MHFFERGSRFSLFFVSAFSSTTLDFVLYEYMKSTMPLRCLEEERIEYASWFQHEFRERIFMNDAFNKIAIRWKAQSGSVSPKTPH